MIRERINFQEKEKGMLLSIRRLLAYGVDFVLLAMVLIGLQMSVYAMTSGFPFDRFDHGYEIEWWVLATMSLPVWLYFILCERLFQKTVGKKLLALKVTDRTGSNINVAQALARTAVRLLPWELTHPIVLVPEPWWSVEEPGNLYLIYIPNALLLLYIAALFWNRGAKSIHDGLAGTRVTRAKQATPPQSFAE